MNGPYYEVRYLFRSDDQAEFEFVVVIDKKTLTHQLRLARKPPSWTSLAAQHCDHCTLDRNEHAYCPAALSLVAIVEQCDRLLSYETVDVTVQTPERTQHKRTSVQKALSSLIGLQLATSGCPSLSLLKPMARFHLPFATREETLYRAASAYLLGQYFRKHNGHGCDLDLGGLREAYQRIQHVNHSIAHRLRQISRGDANVNAIVLLDLFAQELSWSIDERLQSLEYLFQDYLEPTAQEL
ncbi:MAG: hypothetical protein IT368_01510 [Candidatus Hydrogenedentes bacterium]|nr:hypothetical protein [Candidatus Hydrogenedentota bacterium]